MANKSSSPAILLVQPEECISNRRSQTIQQSLQRDTVKRTIRWKMQIALNVLLYMNYYMWILNCCNVSSFIINEILIINDVLILNSVFALFGKFIGTLCDANGGFSDSVGNEMQHTMKEGNETDVLVQFTRCSLSQLILLCTTVP